MTTKLGLENFLESHVNLVAGKRVALLACPSSIDRNLRSSIDLLHQHPAVNLAALFGPEHGIRGDVQAGAKVSSAIDPLTKLPVYSLYGKTHKPTADMLADIDIIMIDLQDAGVRFYTFVATMFYVMQAAREASIKVIILDRPAPINGTRIEGPMLDPAFASFVGPSPLPIRYGMTIGELSRLLNQDAGCDHTVIPLEGWSRERWYDQTGLPFIPSSPNLPTLDSVALYPGACLVEGTNVSEGRGTTRPFEYLGAPWINAEALTEALNALDLEGVRFRPVYFIPTFSKHQGKLCAGAHVYVTDRDLFQPVRTMLHVLQTLKRSYSDHFAWRSPWIPGKHRPIDLLWGSDSLRRHLDADRPVEEVMSSRQADLQEFDQWRANYLLYPES